MHRSIISRITASTLFLLALAGGHALGDKSATKPPPYKGNDMCGSYYAEWFPSHAKEGKKGYNSDEDYRLYRALYDCEVQAAQFGFKFYTPDPFEAQREAVKKEAAAAKPVAPPAAPESAPAASSASPSATSRAGGKPYSLIHCPGKTGPDEPYGNDNTRWVPADCELVERIDGKDTVVVPAVVQHTPPSAPTTPAPGTKGGRIVQVEGQTYRLPRGVTLDGNQGGGTSAPATKRPVTPVVSPAAAQPTSPTYRTECGIGKSQLWGTSRPPENLFKTCKVFQYDGKKETQLFVPGSGSAAPAAATSAQSGSITPATGATPTPSAMAALAARRAAASAKPAKAAPAHVSRLTEAKHEPCKPLFEKYQSDYWAWRQPIEDVGNPPPPMSQNPPHVEEEYRAFEECERSTTEREATAAIAAQEREGQEKKFWVVPRGHFADKISDFERRRTGIGLRVYGQMTFRFLAGPSEQGRYAPPAGLCGNIGGTFFSYSRLRPFAEAGFCGTLDNANLASFNWAGGLEYKILEWLILDAGVSGDHGLNDHLFLSSSNNRAVRLAHADSYGAILRIGAQLFTPRVTTFAGFRFFDRGYSGDPAANLVAKTGGAAEVTLGLRALIW